METKSQEPPAERLPETFTVKYLGNMRSKGLWGLKNTRAPVDKLVNIAKTSGMALPLMKLTVSKEGCTLTAGTTTTYHPIDTVSYGVQDVVYTRIFSMIVVREDDDGSPFQCHAFVCENREVARKVTYCLATAFREYGIRKNYKGPGQQAGKFAVDLRSPEDQEADLRTPDSSEA